ncbi:MAG: ABC transporter ATP-binding protein [Acidimicrobiia bacterium]|nr:ABC transporter ATP-binding protein [Acidimicrobiia bacterium]
MPSTTATTLLEATGVRRVLGAGATRVEVLKGIDLRIDAGDLVMVMGRSGSGKTTLLNCLAGLDDIDDGTVSFCGEDVHAMAEDRRALHRARNMGFIFQGSCLIPVLSAVENVELPLLILGCSPRQARSRALDLLERVRLAGRAEHRPAHLSGGEQQRVALALALAAEPQIVWADEPTSSLDGENAAIVLDLLGDVHADGQTLVIITHDLAIAASGTRLVQVSDGRVTHDGLPDLLPPLVTLEQGACW